LAQVEAVLLHLLVVLWAQGGETVKLTQTQCAARATALEEAADHLDLHWTDNTDEVAQGKQVSASLRAQAKKWWERDNAR
jgi:hypothetical protein